MNNFSRKTSTSWLNSENLLRSLLFVLWSRKWVIVGATILTFLLTAVASWLMKPVYVSSASILVKKERFDAPVTPEQMFPSGHPDTRLTEEEINSEVEILNSPSLHEDVIKRLRLEQGFIERQSNSVLAALRKEAPASQDTERTALALALTDFQDKLFVEPIKKTNLIRITFK
ncbi:MAG TPA: Wzz/FepE/Etk N-terminal domain-containing protein, partial [Blastocatellia bacterium]|nr:Wzz/FepE/Etk N-terminal domain-containing protein [Blastocatellia bacterium]